MSANIGCPGCPEVVLKSKDLRDYSAPLDAHTAAAARQHAMHTTYSESLSRHLVGVHLPTSQGIHQVRAINICSWVSPSPLRMGIGNPPWGSDHTHSGVFLNATNVKQEIRYAAQAQV